MAELESLSIVIDVIEQFEKELDLLLFKLGEVETAAQAVDPIRIDVEVNDAGQLEMLAAQLFALEGADLSGFGDVVTGTKRVNRSGGGGTARFSRNQFERINNLLTAQMAQMGRVIRDLNANMGDFGDSMRHTMSAADKAADSFELSNLRMSDLHNALAKVMPLLFVMIGSLPAIIAGLVAVAAAAFSAAAALAAITGFGALGAAMARGDGDIGEGFTDILEEIQDDFMDAFSPLARRLEPVFESFVEGLGRMFQEIANMENVLFNVVDEARSAGSFLSDFLVGTIEAMGRMADAFGPVFGMIGEALEDMDLLRNLTQFMADILPEMVMFVGVVADMIVSLVKMSEGFLLVTAGILGTLNAFFSLIEVLPITKKQFGVLLASVLTLVSGMLILNSAIIPATISALFGLGKSLLAAVVAFTDYTAAAFFSAAGSLAAAKAILVLVGALTLGIGALVAAVGITSALGNSFGGLSTDIDSATDSLRSFRKEQNRMSGRNPYRDPNVQRGDFASPAGSGGDVNVTIEGDADDETVRNQTQNALYRLERPRRL